VRVGIGPAVATVVMRRPAFVAPMLATPTPTLPVGPDWWFEAKWDGIRAVAVLRAGRLTLWTRNRVPVTDRFPELAVLPEPLTGRDAVFDGEVVALDEAGRPDFGLLARGDRGGSGPGAPRRYFAFDLLFWAGDDLMGTPLADRRTLLRSLGLEAGGWRVPAHVEADPAAMRAFVERHALEGVVAKRRDSVYEPGRRSGAWRKWKRTRRQEFVVGGWVPGRGGRAGEPGSLLLGAHDPTGVLRYCGRVGTGFGTAERRRLQAALVGLARPTPPFVDPPHLREARWADPRLVVEVRFSAWTADGRLRHPVYVGRRLDKDPAEVMRELS